MTKLDREPLVGWKSSNERSQVLAILRRRFKACGELDQYYAEVRIQRPDDVDKLIHDPKAQRTKREFVSDRPRRLEAKKETVWSRVCPSLEGGCCRRSVGGGVDLDGVEYLRVERQHLGRLRAARVENLIPTGLCHPVVVLPTLAPDMKFLVALHSPLRLDGHGNPFSFSALERL